MIYLRETILRYIFLIFLILFGFSTKGYTDVIKFNQLVIEDPWIKESPSNHPVTGGYLTIRNLGKTEDILINVSADFAMKSEIHEMKMERDVMKMRSLENGLIIPAGGEIHLKPGPPEPKQKVQGTAGKGKHTPDRAKKIDNIIF